jgi:hypothetical protein
MRKTIICRLWKKNGDLGFGGQIANSLVAVDIDESKGLRTPKP